MSFEQLRSNVKYKKEAEAPVEQVDQEAISLLLLYDKG